VIDGMPREDREAILEAGKALRQEPISSDASQHAVFRVVDVDERAQQLAVFGGALIGGLVAENGPWFVQEQGILEFDSENVGMTSERIERVEVVVFHPMHRALPAEQRTSFVKVVLVGVRPGLDEDTSCFFDGQHDSTTLNMKEPPATR
jgi:hypothetical protein